jgi:hypothetical protein
MSLAWQGGSFVVRADTNTLKLMFPGLVVGLNNGSGNVYYVVTGVYPMVNADGTHPGYFTVMNISNGNGSPVLTGTIGTEYTATLITQQPFSWSVVANSPQTSTVANLPTGATIGQEEYVSDAISCTYNSAVTGSGSTVCHVRYNGTAWVAN